MAMDKILFSSRLKAQRKACGFNSTRAFAGAYNVRYRNGTASMEDDSGILGTLKNYENPNHPGIPRLDIVANICEMLDCDVDYLLGKIDLPKHEYEAIYQKCGLSLTAIDAISEIKNGIFSCWLDTLSWMLANGLLDVDLLGSIVQLKTDTEEIKIYDAGDDSLSVDEWQKRSNDYSRAKNDSDLMKFKADSAFRKLLDAYVEHIKAPGAPAAKKGWEVIDDGND